MQNKISKNKTLKMPINGKETTFTFLESLELPELSKITSAAIIPFLDDGRIVATILNRGVDIPGGHQEKGDKSLFNILERELMEEVGATIKNDIKIIQVVASDYYDYETYMVVAVGLVNTIVEDFKPAHESLGRKIMTVDEFIKEYNSGMKDEMTKIVLRAREFFDCSCNCKNTNNN